MDYNEYYRFKKLGGELLIRKKRRVLIGILAFLFPFLFQFLSPVIPVEGLLDDGILVGAIFTFAFQFLISIFFGRIFCGWMCAGGAYQEAFCSHMNEKKPNPKIDKIKFVSWAIWIVALIVLVIFVGGIKKVNFFYNTYYIRTVDIWGYYFIIYSIVSLVIFLSASIVGKRGFCHSLCWMAPFMIVGNKIGRKLRVPQLKLKTNPKQCIGCKKCEKNCRMGLDVVSMVQEGTIDNFECILCGECIDECPKKVIKYTFKK